MAEYISREAVVRYLKGYSEKERNSNSPFGMITSNVLNKAERAISETPAADVQRVRHGRWIWDSSPEFGNPYGSYTCSECGDIQPYRENYCPNCGARMDGDAK